jgi:hypothetical protein
MCEPQTQNRRYLGRRQARNGIETLIAGVPGGLSLTWSEAIFSDAPTLLDILCLPEVRYALGSLTCLIMFSRTR